MKPFIRLDVAAGRAKMSYHSPYSGEHTKEVVCDDGKGQEKLLMTIIEALKAVQKPSRIMIKMPSGQIKTAIYNRWPEKWAVSGWVNARKKPVKYRILWQKYAELAAGHEITIFRGDTP